MENMQSHIVERLKRFGLESQHCERTGDNLKMNKRDYIEQLHTMLTDKQKDFLKKVFPNGVDAKQLPSAIGLIERTLRKGNTEIESLKDEIKEKENSINELISKNQVATETIKQQQEEINDLTAQVRRLSNPITEVSSEIQEKLDKLEALENGGVDNWEWYGESMSALRG
jgi:septal ring factor EnvC (AmiA/AmiB activator)